MPRSSMSPGKPWETLFFMGAITFWLLLTPPTTAICGASEPEVPTVNRKLVVGTKETPPFAMKDSNGHWTGISIDLWRQIAEELNLTYEWRELDQSGLLAGLTDGSLDAVVANLTITPGRLDNFDFTYPFYYHRPGDRRDHTRRKCRRWHVLHQLFSWTVLKIALALIFLLFLVGLLIWLLERKTNKEQFGGSPVRGNCFRILVFGSDHDHGGIRRQAPQDCWRPSGGFFWMFASIILVSFFTATITSLLTVKQLVPSIRGLEDIKKVGVGTLPYTTSETFLQTNRISFTTYPSVVEGLEALDRGEIKAFVYDIPALRYWIKRQFFRENRIIAA